MVNVFYAPLFRKKIKKFKDNSLKKRLKTQIKKIIYSPEIGKPMKFCRKGTREVYVKPFRLSYFYSKDRNKILFLEIYHKDEQ
tara:strand:+ start:1642 stop:1890 length:249 start_codon:yes stop_codon:yes gene_type:complete